MLVQRLQEPEGFWTFYLIRLFLLITSIMAQTRKVSAVGSKAMVWHGSANHTSGGLTRKDLMKTKKGRIVSKKKHAIGKKRVQTLRKLGFKPKKGTFKLFRK